MPFLFILSIPYHSSPPNIRHTESPFNPPPVLDGQFTDALNFVLRCESNYSYDAKEINYIINKHRFVELLCLFKSDYQSNSTREDLLNCLGELERCCSSKEEYHKFVVLLDLTSLDQHPDFRVGISISDLTSPSNRFHFLNHHFPILTNQNSPNSLSNQSQFLQFTS